jgi:hypothetical protein
MTRMPYLQKGRINKNIIPAINMKGCLILVVLVIAIGLLINLFSEEDPVFADRINRQPNPFSTHKDSGHIIWARAIRFLEIHKRIIAAGEPQIRDSLIIVPYANSYRKGNSISIRRTSRGDSVMFFCEWWDSKDIWEGGGKEIALYMQQGVWRYDEEN